MLRRSIICAAAVVSMPSLLLAQSPVAPQIEQSRQFHSIHGGASGFANRAESESAVLGGEGTGDDAFGEQLILKRMERPRPFSAFAEIGAFLTNNVALARHDAQRDGFLVASTGVVWSEALASNVRLEASARGSSYRYDKFPELDFQSTDLSAGISWTPPQLKGAEVHLRYTFSDLTAADHIREFYKNHAILLGVQKAVPLTRIHAVYFGANAQWSFADPKPAGRDEYAAYIGWRAQLTRRIDADVSYRFGCYVYRFGAGRADANHTVSASLHYAPSEWLAMTASGFFSANRSNQGAFDYDAGNAGAGLQFALPF